MKSEEEMEALRISLDSVMQENATMKETIATLLSSPTEIEQLAADKSVSKVLLSLLLFLVIFRLYFNIYDTALKFSFLNQKDFIQITEAEKQTMNDDLSLLVTSIQNGNDFTPVTNNKKYISFVYIENKCPR